VNWLLPKKTEDTIMDDHPAKPPTQDPEVGLGHNPESSEVTPQLALERDKLRFDRQKYALEVRLKKREFREKERKNLWKDVLTNPVTIAIVGGLITVITALVTNYFNATETRGAEAAKAALAEKSAKETLEADLIKKFVESPSTETVRQNLRFLVDAGLLPSYADSIRNYLDSNPGVAPQVGGGVEFVPSGGGLGPLAELPGTWTGKGFNVIWRPNGASGKDHFLELNVTNETLRFERIEGATPVRGLLQPDINMFSLSYQQTTWDANVKGSDGKPARLNFEFGIWATVPETKHPQQVPTVVRQASTPQGTSFVAQGIASLSSEAPVITDINITPFVIGNPAKLLTFPESNLSHPSEFRTPPSDLTGVYQAIVDNPNLVLKRALEGKTIKKMVILSVSADISNPVLGGGLASTAFLQGSPNEGPIAQPVSVRATYWIETLKDDAGAPDVQQLQYTQTVLLNFNGLSWPHITVATLRKAVTGGGSARVP
jgi:hypothetical protein